MDDDDHHHHHRLHQVPDYGDGTNNNNNDTDLRHFFSPRPMFSASGPRPPPPPPPLLHHQSPFSGSGGAFTPLPYNPLPHYTYELVMDRGHVPDHVHHHSVVGAGAGAVDFNSDSTTSSAAATAIMPTSLIGFDTGGGGGATARWPRQETLTLLEVRSRLDHKFKEANHKGPLWDEVSRIMCDEHGYQRSGKKCREKFENLYKYYKKTKGGKAGRQDGKNYRFFRQLDALYGDTSTANTASDAPHQFHTTMNTPTTNISLYDHHQEAKAHSISLTNSSSELQTSSSEDKAQRSSWKSKIKGFLDVQMKRIMDRQDSWLEKMETTLECREKERMMRDEEWRTRESERMEREHRLWVEERAWIEARDRAMISALEKISGKELLVEDKDLSSSLHSEDHQLHPQSRALLESGNKEEEDDQYRWEEAEMTELIRLRSSMDARFEHCGGSELDQVSLWEEIASRMASMGYDRRSATLCKEKWDLVNSVLMKNHNKRKESRRIESFGCSTSSHQQPAGQSNLRYDYGESNCTRSNVTVPPDIGLGGGGGGGGGNPMNDSFTFLLGND